MDILSIVEQIGEAPTAALLGVITGVIFGISAQRSRFCLVMIGIPWLHASNARSTDCFPGQRLWPDNAGEPPPMIRDKRVRAATLQQSADLPSG